MLKEMKIYASRVVLRCLNCGNEVQSETHVGTALGRPARLFCSKCNKPNTHKAIAYIHTYEELDDVVWPPPPAPGVNVSPAIEAAIEVDTDPGKAFPETKEEEPEGEDEGTEDSKGVFMEPILEGEGLEVLPEGDPEDNTKEDEESSEED